MEFIGHPSGLIADTICSAVEIAVLRNDDSAAAAVTAQSASSRSIV